MSENKTNVQTMAYWPVIIVFLYAVTVEGTCPSGFEHHGDTCYKFVKQELSWKDAQDHCHMNYGAHLATVETAEENKFLTNYLNAHAHTLFGYDLWLGATDANPEKTWKWVVTDNSQVTFTDWSPGQPDGSYGGLERCLEFESEYNLKWNDDECDDHNLFICERPFNPPIPPIHGIGR